MPSREKRKCSRCENGKALATYTSFRQMWKFMDLTR
jgi:ribosomal protein S27AE